jgi:1,4-alpha-glucan branching enzyme
VISFMRRESTTGRWLVVVANFTPQSHSHYRIGVPVSGFYSEVFNTDAERYGGSNLGNLGGKFTDEWGIHGYEHSLDLCLPPLSVLVFQRDDKRSQEPLCDETAAAGLPLG